LRAPNKSEVDHQVNKVLKIAIRNKNPNAKFAKFLIIVQNFQSAGVKLNIFPYTRELSIAAPASASSGRIMRYITLKIVSNHITILSSVLDASSSVVEVVVGVVVGVVVVAGCAYTSSTKKSPPQS
jgi:hypothetical protein